MTLLALAAEGLGTIVDCNLAMSSRLPVDNRRLGEMDWRLYLLDG